MYVCVCVRVNVGMSLTRTYNTNIILNYYNTHYLSEHSAVGVLLQEGVAEREEQRMRERYGRANRRPSQHYSPIYIKIYMYYIIDVYILCNGDVYSCVSAFRWLLLQPHRPSSSPSLRTPHAPDSHHFGNVEPQRTQPMMVRRAAISVAVLCVRATTVRVCAGR